MDAEQVYGVLNSKIKNIQVSGGGVSAYKDLSGKPQINGVTLQGNLTSEDLNLNSGTEDYTQLEGKPLINGVELDGNKSLEDLGIMPSDAEIDYEEQVINKPTIPTIPAVLPNPFPINFNLMSKQQTYDGSESVNVIFPDVEILNESAGTPVGEIISYMGVNAPPNYLICDGTEYQIADYPYLTQHFQDNFGKVNYFGGDGITTFAVPDLRGEFLRGTGTASRNTGSGASVGVHQNGTSHPFVYKYGSVFGVAASTNHQGFDVKPDSWDKEVQSKNFYAQANASIAQQTGTPATYTSRPTNTSVLFCIKYKPTYFATVGHTYSYEERRIGTWVDGKPLYEKTVDFGSLPNATTKEVPHGIEDVDLIWVHDGYCLTSQNSIPLNYYLSGDGGFGAMYCNKNKITATASVNRAQTNATVVLRYTKTTD